jgi:hypothetical protein
MHHKMAKEDEEKMAFITICRVYCYVCMPFGLKNAGATFHRLMRKTLGAQMGRNAEAYVDDNDIIIKTREGHTLSFLGLTSPRARLLPPPLEAPSGKALVAHQWRQSSLSLVFER